MTLFGLATASAVPPTRLHRMAVIQSREPSCSLSGTHVSAGINGCAACACRTHITSNQHLFGGTRGNCLLSGFIPASMHRRYRQLAHIFRFAQAATRSASCKRILPFCTTHAPFLRQTNLLSALTTLRKNAEIVGTGAVVSDAYHRSCCRKVLRNGCSN